MGLGDRTEAYLGGLVCNLDPFNFDIALPFQAGSCQTSYPFSPKTSYLGFMFKTYLSPFEIGQ